MGEQKVASRTRDSVEPLADAWRERAVDGRVAERALNAHRLEAAVGIGKSRDADHCVQLEKGDRRGRVFQVDFPGLELLLQSVRERVHVHLEADVQRGLRRDAGADAAVPLARDGFVQLEGVAPEASLPNVS